MHDPTNARASDGGSSRKPRQAGGRQPASIHLLLTLEDVVNVLGGHRLEILFLLAAYGSMMVTKIADHLVLDKGTVSHELRRLMESGLVRWARLSTSHIYQMTERVRTIRDEGIVQIGIMVESGDWVWFHRYFGSACKRVVPLPDRLVDCAAPIPLIDESRQSVREDHRALEHLSPDPNRRNETLTRQPTMPDREGRARRMKT